MRIKFGPWLPDQPDLDSGGLEECVNCMPLESGYGPLRNVGSLSGSTTVTITTSASLQLVSFKPLIIPTNSGSDLYLAGGDPARVWKFHYSTQSDAVTLTDVGRTATYSVAATQWVFTRFGSSIIAGALGQTMQISTSGANFRDMSASASAPTVTRLATVRDFVFAAEAGQTNATVRWSQINNAERWGINARNQADRQVLPDVTTIQGITGGDFATIIGDNSVWRATYVGSPVIFRFDVLYTNIRCYSPYTIARYENVTFFAAMDGIAAFDGANLLRIGRGKVDRYIQANYPDRSHWLGVVDPHNKLYVLGVKASIDGLVTELLIYGIETGNWTRVTGLSNIQHIMGSLLVAAAGSLDSFTLERASDLAVGQLGIGVLEDSGSSLLRYSEFNSDTYMTATFATGEAQLFPDRRAMVQRVRPLIQGNSSTSVTVEVGKRNKLSESVTYTSAVAMNANGVCPVRADARYHRVRVNVSGGFERSIGFDLDAVKAGIR